MRERNPEGKEKAEGEEKRGSVGVGGVVRWNGSA